MSFRRPRGTDSALTSFATVSSSLVYPSDYVKGDVTPEALKRPRNASSSSQKWSQSSPNIEQQLRPSEPGFKPDECMATPFNKCTIVNHDHHVSFNSPILSPKPGFAARKTSLSLPTSKINLYSANDDDDGDGSFNNIQDENSGSLKNGMLLSIRKSSMDDRTTVNRILSVRSLPNSEDGNSRAGSLRSIHAQNEHDRTVQALIDTLSRDLVQERLTVKTLLQQERNHQARENEILYELQHERENTRDLIARLYQARLEVDQKERLLQRALQDARAWKKLAVGSQDRERALALQLASSSESVEKIETHSHSPFLRWFKLGYYKQNKLNKIKEQWRRSEQEVARLREDNISLGNALIEAQKKDSIEKSTDALLYCHRQMIRNLADANGNQSLLADLENSMLNSMLRSNE
jgi:hypothetical protein